MVATILEAAERVLLREGARRFTTTRVAEQAGVSVGSMYQYFPNKQALLFRLQTEEWRETAEVIEEILADEATSPLLRLRRAVRTFFASERYEAELRRALRLADASYHDMPEARAQNNRAKSVWDDFLAEALPDHSKQERARVTDLMIATLAALAKFATEERPTKAGFDALAKDAGDMLSAYLESLAGGAPRGAPG